MAYYTNSKKERQEMLRRFRYLNTFPTDFIKAQKMSNKVYWDLKPFCEYLEKSIENLKKVSKIGAKCFRVEDRLILKPTFSLLKVKSLNAVTCDKPQGNFYILDWNDEWGDINSFETITQRFDKICDQSAIIDVYNRKALLRLDKEIDTTKKYSLFLFDEEAKPCTLRPVNYRVIADYRAVSEGTEIVSASERNGKITFTYSGAEPQKITLFRTFEQAANKAQSHRFAFSKLSMKGVKLTVYDEDNGLIEADSDDDELPRLYDGQHELKYDILKKEEVFNLIKGPNLEFEDGKITTGDGTLKDGEFITIKGLKFKVSALIGQVRRTLKDKNKKYIGTFIELEEDDDFADDIYSNVSHFFKETAEILTDTQGDQGRNKRYFKIGSRYENFRQIEICEIIDKKYVRVKNLPKMLYVEPNTRQLKMQLAALKVLMNSPSLEHAPLLELMNDFKHRSWGKFDADNIHIRKWYRLTSSKYKGCESQRSFVKKALATPDFAILEGPPGSGKTTTILEIIAQMIERGQKVMLAASTNAAIDNILERLDDLPEDIHSKILAVRIGNESAISESVKDFTTFNLDPTDRDEIVRRANLVCGTTIGVLHHPEFNLSDSNQPVIPLYDCLIVDEASKTTFQEFMVPAIYAKKWILSGDLKQLTPYIEQDSVESSIKDIPSFDAYHQRAQTILMTLRHNVYNRRRKDDNTSSDLKFCFIVKDEILDAVADLIPDYEQMRIALIGELKHPQSVTASQFLRGDERAFLVYGARVLFVSEKYFGSIEKSIPQYFIPIYCDENSYPVYLSAAYHKKFNARIFSNDFLDVKKFREQLVNEIKDNSWSKEIAWRLCRMQELFLLAGEDSGDRRYNNWEKYKKQIEERIPSTADEDIQKTISLVRGIALPSIIQLLQRGVDEEIVRNLNPTTLNKGFSEEDLDPRRTLVEYQHRMHSDISAFPAKHIYEGKALKDGNAERSWNYYRYIRRAYWLDVPEDRKNVNRNLRECEVVLEEINGFCEFAKAQPKEDGSPWTIACLTYYRKQETELKNKIKKFLNQDRTSSFYKSAENNVEIMVYTIDKFQGKEADLVFLSLVKSGGAGLGFMDSPNRLNVALTRAKFQLVVVGSKEYFTRCQSDLLKSVAEEY